MLKGFSTRIIASVCIVLFLFALLIPLSESWGINVITAACSSSSGGSILRTSSILRTEGTNRPDIMLGCNTPDVMYGKSDNDVLQGGDGEDYFDCGDGLDVIVDYDSSEGDTHTNNCEDIRERL